MVSAVAAIIAVVLAFTGPLVVIGSPVSTEPGALRVEPLPDDKYTAFYLPPDAPLAEMPLLSKVPEHFPCSPDMVDWLAEHGVELPSYRMSVRNNADAGPMLTIDNVRVVDKEKIAPRPGFTFSCGDQGTPAVTAVLSLDLDQDEPATFVDQELEVIRPFAFNLAPGEQGHIEIHMRSAVDGYSGRVVADVTGGGTTERVELLLGGFEHTGLGRSARFSVEPTETPGLFSCVDSRSGSVDADRCDAEQVRSIVSEMWE